MWELGFAEIDVTLALTAASMGFACWTGVSKREALPVLPHKILEELVQFHRHTFSCVSFSRAAVSLCSEDCMLVLLAKDALNKGITIGNLIHMQPCANPPETYVPHNPMLTFLASFNDGEFGERELLYTDQLSVINPLNEEAGVE